VFCQHCEKPDQHPFRLHVSQAKNDDTGQNRGTGGQEISEVQVMSDDDSLLDIRELKNLRIWERVEAAFMQVDCIMAMRTPNIRQADGDSHIK
jgi:hypothetical protein